MTKITALISLLFAGSLSIHAQNYLVPSGGISNDEVLDITEDSEGNVCAIGYFGGMATIGGSTFTASGISDIFVQKIDPLGNTLWAYNHGGNGLDRGTGIAVDGEGNILITGTFTQTTTIGSFTLSGASDQLEVFIAKLSPDGTVLWAQSCGGIDNDYAYSIAVDLENNVVVTGQFKGTAQFGGTTLISLLDDDFSEPSYDIFIAKLSSEGDWMWIQQGSATGDDRGLGITTDQSNNVYVCGQFSSSITFDFPHENDVENAGFVVKFDQLGQEDWFMKLAANHTLCNEIVFDGDDLLLVGDYTGQLLIETEEIEFVPFEYEHNIFILNISVGGDLNWYSTDGSDNWITATGIDFEDDGIVIGGTFLCTLTEYNIEFDEANFLSSGYADVFISRYDTEGVRQWSRNVGGPGRDACAGIVAGGDSPTIAGSFEHFFHAPGQVFFGDATCEIYGPVCGVYCTDEFYQKYTSIPSAGGKDAFFGRPIMLEREPFDFFERHEPGCNREVIEPCIIGTDPSTACQPYADQCPEEIIVCNQFDSLKVNTFIAKNVSDLHSLGPQFDFEWSTGETSPSILPLTSGTYWVQVTRKDGCDSYYDEVEVIVAPEICPLISDNINVNDEDCFTEEIEVCVPTPVSLWGETEPDWGYTWLTPGGDLIETDLVIAELPGGYSFTITDEYDCQWTTSVDVDFNYALEAIDPWMGAALGLVPIEDGSTINICEGDPITLQSGDGWLNDLYTTNVQVTWLMYLNGELINSSTILDEDAQPDTQTGISFQPLVPGVYEFVCTQSILNPEPCEGEVYYDEESISFTVEINSSVQALLDVSGEDSFCPGASTILTASGNGTISWTGPTGFFPDALTVEANEEGWYTATCLIEIGSCSDWTAESVYVSSETPPVVTSDPGDGIICPGESLTLTCELGTSYNWVGPLGELLGEGQSIEVETPGSYYCIQTNSNNCSLESNSIEAVAYSTPFLVASSNADLCFEGMVTVELVSNSIENVWWAAPLSNDLPIQTIIEPGQYSVSVEFCNIPTTLEIQVISTPVNVEIDLESPILCDGGSVELSAPDELNEILWWPEGITTSTLEVTEPGIYILLGANDIGCQQQSSIEVFAENTVAPSLEEITPCLGDDFTLDSNSPVDVIWSLDPLGEMILGENSTLEFEDFDTPTGVYVQTVDQNCGVLSDYLYIDVLNIQLSIGDTSLCLPSTLNLVAGTDFLGDVEWSWSPSILLTDPLESETGILTDESLTVTVTGVDEFGCVVEAQAEITQHIENTDLGSDIHQCEDETALLDTGWPEDYTIEWSTGATTSAIEITESGLYSVEVTSPDGCYSEDEIELTVHTYPEFDLGAIAYACQGEFVQLNTGLEGWNTLWSSGDETSWIYVIQSGVYFVEVNDGFCFASDQVEVIFNPVPNVHLPQDTTICFAMPPYEAELNLGDPEGTLVWSTGQTDPIITISNPGIYTASIYNDHGCGGEYEVEVIDECFGTLYIPNSFTPDGDGHNDVWQAYGENLNYLYIQIFNRWGEVIFEITDVEQAWQGQYRDGDHLVPDGIYPFRAEYALNDLYGSGIKEEILHGHISLIR